MQIPKKCQRPADHGLFDLISRSLVHQTFDQRPIELMVLGPRDTVVEVTARRLAPAPLTWGGHVTRTARLMLDDGINQILLWHDPRGRLLQLEDASSGLRVVRDAGKKTSAATPARRRSVMPVHHGTVTAKPTR